MVYWGCGTPRNRLAWVWVLTVGAAGAALFAMGAAKLDACKYIQVVLQAVSIDACSMPPKSMLIAGAALMVAALPPLLFFSGCAAPPPAGPARCGEQSDITVVRQGHNGVALTYKYDGAGRLVVAPDRASEANVERAAAALRASGGASGGGWGRASPKLCETYVPRVWDSASCYVEVAPRPASAARGGGGGGARADARDAAAAAALEPRAAELLAAAGGLSPLHAGRQAGLVRGDSDLYKVTDS